MTAILLDGKAVRDRRALDLAKAVEQLGVRPRLVIVQVGNSEASSSYIRQKKLFGERIGCEVVHESYPEGIGQDELVREVGRLSALPGTHGVIVQLPLPGGIDPRPVVDAIPQTKDVDGLGSANFKSVADGKGGHAPATPKGILTLLDAYGIPLEGKRAVVVGRSALVGKPLALMLLGRNATVTVCHRRTVDLAAETSRAEVLVVAAGSPGLIGRGHVSPGQVVIDVGMTLAADGPRRFLGDVDFEAVKDVVSAVSPVPGGVGPMTVLSLFENLAAACAEEIRRVSPVV